MPFAQFWRLRLLPLWTRISRAEVGLIAAGIAFFGFLAIFPAIAAVIAIWGFAADPMVVQTQLELAENYLPNEAFDLLYSQVQRILATNNRSLGFATAISTLFALWSARAGVGALIGGINAVHGLPERSGFWHLARALSLTFALIALALSAMALAVIAPLVIGFLPLGTFQARGLEAANFTLGLLLVSMGIGLSYRFAPHRKKSDHRPGFLTRGLFLALILWALVSRGLVFYLANFNSYNEVYGSIGAVVALLMWFYLSAYAVLLGAAVDAEHAARLKKDTGQ